MSYKFDGFPIQNEQMQEWIEDIANIDKPKDASNYYQSALIVGWREATYNSIFHSLFNCGYKEIVLIDIFKPNIEKFMTEGVKGVRAKVMDVRDVLEKFGEERFDLIVWAHGFEHLEMNDSLNTINDLKKIAKYYLMGETPAGDWCSQDEMYGNVHEVHHSIWEEEDFHRLGFITTSGEEDKHIIGLWKKNESGS